MSRVLICPQGSRRAPPQIGLLLLFLLPTALGRGSSAPELALIQTVPTPILLIFHLSISISSQWWIPFTGHLILLQWTQFIVILKKKKIQRGLFCLWVKGRPFTVSNIETKLPPCGKGLPLASYISCRRSGFWFKEPLAIHPWATVYQPEVLDILSANRLRMH